MVAHRVQLFRSCLAPLAFVFVASTLACGREPIAGPRVRADDALPATARTSTALAVTSASPPFGDQGTTVDVHVFGSGFTAGAQATWLLHGVADAHVHTNSTNFISSSELVANITIASDASLDFWDVQVSLSSGKNGVGSECFEVTSAQILGPGTLGGDTQAGTINDLLQVVGTSNTKSTTVAWIYDDATGMVKLGNGAAGGLDPLGEVVVGSDGNSLPTSWIRQPDNSWSVQPLSLISGGLQGGALSAARLGDGTLVAVGWNSISGKRVNTTYPNRPVQWQRINGAWTSPQLLVMPAGAASATARDVNQLGQVTGILDAPSPGIVWESPTTYVLLDGAPGRINPAGTLIVGQRDRVAVYWFRDAVTHAWHTTGVPLPTIAGPACTDGFARDVNDAGVIVGWSCNTSGNHQATVWLLDLSGPGPALKGTLTPLPGLGAKSGPAELSVAAAVTDNPPYVVTGKAISGTYALAVRWLLR